MKPAFKSSQRYRSTRLLLIGSCTFAIVALTAQKSHAGCLSWLFGCCEPSYCCYQPVTCCYPTCSPCDTGCSPCYSSCSPCGAPACGTSPCGPAGCGTCGPGGCAARYGIDSGIVTARRIVQPPVYVSARPVPVRTIDSRATIIRSVPRIATQPSPRVVAPRVTPTQLIPAPIVTADNSRIDENSKWLPVSSGRVSPRS